MSRKRWTFLFIKDEGSPVRQLSVPVRTGHFLASGITGAVLLLTSLLMVVVIDAQSRLDVQRLTGENEALTSEIAGIQGRVQALEGTLDQLSNRDARYRVLAGLESLDSEILQVGVGGPGLATPESGPIMTSRRQEGKDGVVEGAAEGDLSAPSCNPLSAADDAEVSWRISLIRIRMLLGANSATIR